MLGGVCVPAVLTQANLRRKKAGTISAGQLGNRVRTNTFIVVNSMVGYQASFRFAALATSLTREPNESLLCTGYPVGTTRRWFSSPYINTHVTLLNAQPLTHCYAQLRTDDVTSIGDETFATKLPSSANKPTTIIITDDKKFHPESPTPCTTHRQSFHRPQVSMDMNIVCTTGDKVNRLLFQATDRGGIRDLFTRLNNDCLPTVAQVKYTEVNGVAF
ncbi:hypothetical protein T265_08379 [Opisthorchis viverrini]|uniref:Uncharacterized protein n=1 Tax=Opisthorchis viverrini TaxID=6198 RepID=A0A074ZKE8_OPIVI|nr:hypothetical protein T265_08379 [Opisthorchis viverrini]KER23835.1 hypothetical protein T265_08379 [Opisthorchis viverrini]